MGQWRKEEMIVVASSSSFSSSVPVLQSSDNVTFIAMDNPCCYVALSSLSDVTVLTKQRLVYIIILRGIRLSCPQLSPLRSCCWANRNEEGEYEDQCQSSPIRTGEWHRKDSQGHWEACIVVMKKQQQQQRQQRSKPFRYIMAVRYLFRLICGPE